MNRRKAETKKRNTGQECPANPQTGMSALPSNKRLKAKKGGCCAGRGKNRKKKAEIFNTNGTKKQRGRVNAELQTSWSHAMDAKKQKGPRERGTTDLTVSCNGREETKGPRERGTTNLMVSCNGHEETKGPRERGTTNLMVSCNGREETKGPRERGTTNLMGAGIHFNEALSVQRPGLNCVTDRVKMVRVLHRQESVGIGPAGRRPGQIIGTHSGQCLRRPVGRLLRHRAGFTVHPCFENQVAPAGR